MQIAPPHFPLTQQNSSFANQKSQTEIKIRQLSYSKEESNVLMSDEMTGTERYSASKHLSSMSWILEAAKSL